MSSRIVVRGSLPEVIQNTEGLYGGNLVYYSRIVFYKAQNLINPYHNFRHMFHIVWLCYQALRYYGHLLDPRQKRNLMIAALFHDFDHSGQFGHDDLNIERAVRGLRQHILEDDKRYLDDITNILRHTEYPHQEKSDPEIDLRIQILRDADMLQSMDMAWIQHVVFGLSTEWRKSPIEILESQISFIKGIKLSTVWAQKMCNRKKIDSKIKECRDLIEIFGGN